MITFVEGDILLSEAKAIAHGVAPADDFKQGLALSLRENWPSLYKDFRHYCKQSHPKEGIVWAWKGADGPVIFSLLTQEHAPSHQSHPGKAKLSYVNECLRNLVKEVKKEKLESLAITKVATGVGGLDWSDVKPVLEKQLSELEIPIYVYEGFRKGQKAQEA